jgi:uncharacterized membrane protein YecN with MAPEG domain
MAPHITAIYAAVVGLWAVVLSNYVSTMRGKYKILHGDGGNAEMAAVIRRFGNLTEYVPLALILLGMAEASGLPSAWTHGLGILLVVSRLVHPFGVSVAKPANPLRIVGTVGTHIVTAGAALYILWTAFFV